MFTTFLGLRRLLGWLKRSLFKSKKSLPESPKQEVHTSNNTEDVVLKSLDVKLKQEQTQFFEKKNDLRTNNFDFVPIWDTYGLGPGVVSAEQLSYIKEVRDVPEEKYADEVIISHNPWEDVQNRPKDYILSYVELQMLKLIENDNNTNA